MNAPLTRSHRRKKVLAAGAVIFATAALTFGAASAANATATTTQVQTGWSCQRYGNGSGYIIDAYGRHPIFYQSSIYGKSDRCVWVNAQGWWIDLGHADPVYTTVTTYTASFDGPVSGSKVTTAKPTLRGTAKPGDTVTIKDASGKTVGTTVADGNGNWSFTPSSALPNGSNTLSASQSSDGNTASSTFTIAVPVTIVSPAPGSTVTTGTPKLAGSAHPGDTVTLKDGTGKTLGTTVADGNGNWSFTPSSALPNGSNTLSVSQSSDGNTASSTFTIAVPVTIVSPAPGSTVTTGTPTLAGSAHPGDTVTLKDGTGKTLGTAIADANGNWSFTPTAPLADGSSTVTATQSSDGKTASTTFSVFAHVPPVWDLNATGPDAKGDFTLTGKGVAGATVTITDSAGKTWTAAVDSNGDWKATIDSGVTPPLSIIETSRGLSSPPVTFASDPLPVLNPGVAAIALALTGAGVGGVVLVRRRKQSSPAVVL